MGVIAASIIGGDFYRPIDEVLLWDIKNYMMNQSLRDDFSRKQKKLGCAI
jgi:hypothetical protein